MLTRRHIPNLLTMARVVAVPLALLIMLLAPEQKAALLWIFIAASITDFFDGYLARKWNVVSPLGALMDPIADKLLVALMLVYLLVEGGIAPMTTAASGSPSATQSAGGMVSPLFLPVMVILLRELYISGLREFLAHRQIKLPVSKGGKWKTAMQMLATTLLLAALAYAPPHALLHCAAPFVAAFSSDCDAVPSSTMNIVAMLGMTLLYLSALLALTSAVQYTRHALRHMKG